MNRFFTILTVFAITLFLSACAGSPPYMYKYKRGKTAVLHGKIATAPRNAPREVHAAVAAGNRIAGAPYQYGGGHGSRSDGYDCSGATSYILSFAGLMQGSMPSYSFRKFGEKGKGKWITVYARKGHVFLVIAGLRYDTGWTGKPEGPQWSTKSRPTRGYTVRHPNGL